MNITNKSPDSMLLGYFFQFSLSGEQKWEVKLNSEAPYRVAVHVAMPDSLQGNWLSGLNSILRRLQVGNRIPIRLDYENVAQFFTMDQLQSLEKMNPTLSFYLYGTPDRIAEPVTSSKLDLDAIRRSVKRQRYAEESLKRRLEREAAATTST